jgi:hypothetical protein
MDTIKLRILTFKSVLWFGKHNNKSVQQIINTNNVGYLLWVYYYFDGISFIEEILNTILKIKAEYRITKPGSNKIFANQLAEHAAKLSLAKSLHEEHSVKSYCINKNRIKSRKKAEAISRKISDIRYFSKGNLMSRNHGH